MKNNLEAVVEELMETIPEEQAIYRKQINTIIDLLQVRPDTNFTFGAQLDERLQTYRRRSENFQINIDNWVASSIAQLNTIFNDVVVPKPSTANQGGPLKFLTDFKAYI